MQCDAAHVCDSDFLAVEANEAQLLSVEFFCHSQQEVVQRVTIKYQAAVEVGCSFVEQKNQKTLAVSLSKETSSWAVATLFDFSLYNFLFSIIRRELTPLFYKIADLSTLNRVEFT